MNLTLSQCELLLNMFTASVERASKSGIPIGEEYWNDIDNIRKKLYSEISRLATEKRKESIK